MFAKLLKENVGNIGLASVCHEGPESLNQCFSNSGPLTTGCALRSAGGFGRKTIPNLYQTLKE
jgi:hypothetical protein